MESLGPFEEGCQSIYISFLFVEVSEIILLKFLMAEGWHRG